MQILIKVFTLSNQIDVLIDNEIDMIVINNKKIKNLNVNKYINRILRITSNWDNIMIGEGLDGIEYWINIMNGKEIINYHGKNGYPNNFYEFSDLLDEIIQLGRLNQ